MFADPDHPGAKEALADVLEQLGFGSENATWRSFYLSGAYELRHGPSAPALDPGAGMAAALTVDQLFDTLAIRVDGPRAASDSFAIHWNFTDTGEIVRLTLSNGALIQTHNPKTTIDPDLELSLTKQQLLGLMAGHGLDGIDHHGDADVLGRLLALLDTPDRGFPIVTP